MNVAPDGTVTIPSLVKTKSKFVSGMDKTNIVERVRYANKDIYIVTFKTISLAPKIYSISGIDGVETVEQ